MRFSYLCEMDKLLALLGERDIIEEILEFIKCMYVGGTSIIGCGGKGMDTAELAGIRDVLMARSRAIARAWGKALVAQSPVSMEEAQLNARFEGLTEQLITLLTTEPLLVDNAHSIGRDLEVMASLQHKDIVEIQGILSQKLVEDLSIAQTAVLLPRIVTTFSALEAGFFVSKAETAKRFGMEAMSKMGHDLKTPINAITGFSRVILKGIDGPITEFQQQDLTSVYEAGKKLLDMINDMFEVAKSDAGKTDLYEKSFDVADLLGDILKTVQPILARRAYAIKVGGQGDLGMMYGDASQIRWILLGVLFHAARLSGEGSITLSASRERVQKADWLLFEVTKLAAGQPVSFDEAPVQPMLDDGENDIDVAMIAALRFCKELGGTIVAAKDSQGFAKFIVRLPARAIVVELAG